MIKAVIFDMDGVIINSEKIHSLSFETVLKEYGKKPVKNNSGLIQTAGIGAHDNWQILKKQYGLTENIDILINKKRSFHEKLIKKNLIAMPGLFQLLNLLKKNNIKIAIGSSGQLKNILLVIKGLGIEHYFDTIVSAQLVTRRKPHPDIFLKVSEMLYIPPNFCLVLEDSENGVNAAYAAGMKVIAIPTENTKNNNFSKAERVVNSLQSVTIEMINSL